jgi:chromosome segregation ATPase
MMDSQDKTLVNGTAASPVEEQGQNEVIKEEVAQMPAEEATAENTSQVETEEAAPTEDALAPTEEEPRKVYETKAEILERVREIAHGEETPQKDEVDYLKTAFYKLHIAEREAKLKAYIDGGGDPEQYQITPDETEEAFKAEMGIIKEKRAKIFKEQEAEKQENLTKKLAIIEKIKTMITTPEDANKSYKEFQTLQQQWREIKNVPAEKANELWRNYQLYVEQFYDMLRLNSEARELDFKKNLEAKTRLCEVAEKLADEEDVISAFHQLQKLHQEYREIGPVAKEQREEIWNRFKAASTVINKRHQQHFEGIRAKEEENLARKTALCEQVEAIAAEENKGSGDWEKHTKQIIDLQAEWKTIGFAPQKMNVKIFERFRAACDDFFGRKAEYFKTLKDTFKENAEKKRALIEKAKALQDSTEWKSTGDKLIALQKEWKTIGMVPKKLGDQLWEEFLGACNKFFEARKAAGVGQHGEEYANLSKKREVIEKLKAAAEQAGDDIQAKVQKLVEEYNAIGHVPFKEKDKVYAEYHAVLDKLYKDLNISVAKRRLNNFKQNLKQVAERGESALDNERARLFRQYEAIKQEVQTYENNLGFLNASSKKGNSLIDEMNRKVQKLKDDMNLVREKIKAIDAENKEKES